MAKNTNTQAYAIMNELQAEAKGINAIKAVDTSSFITAGEQFAALGVDEVAGCISKVIQKTIISARPYKGKLDFIDMDKDAFSFAVRKISFADQQFEGGSIPVPANGESADPWTFKKFTALELTFAGQNIWRYQTPSITKTQLLNAFTSEGELVSFFGGIMTNMYNELEQARESARRALLVNLIAGKSVSNTKNYESNTYRHLVAEYNAYKGYTADKVLTLTQIRATEYKEFMEFVYAQIKTASLNMTERTRLFHTNVTGKEITRHTPKEDQRLVMLAPEVFNMDASVLSNTFNKELLSYTDFEQVAYWQDILSPAKVVATPTVLKTDGTLEKGASTTCDNVFAVLFDKEAIGLTTIEESVLSTPLNPKGKYINIFAEAQIKNYQDHTENAIVFAFD